MFGRKKEVETRVVPQAVANGALGKAALAKAGGLSTRYGAPGYADIPKGEISLEYMQELMPPDGLLKFQKMMMNDPIVGGLMLHLCLAMYRIKWEIEGDNADFVKQQIKDAEWDMGRLFFEMSSAFIFGFYIGEEIWDYRNGQVMLVDIEPRYQTSIQAINDKDGLVRQFDPSGGMLEIPYKKCLHHVFLSFARNPWGIALMRHLYKPYYYKISVEATEAVGLDRDLTGLPKMIAPEGFDFTAADPDSPNFQQAVADTLNWAVEIVKNVRKDQQQGLVLPRGWDFDIVRGENRTTIPTSEIIARYNTEMAAGLISNFLALGAFATTNNSNTNTHVNNFVGACESLAAVMANSIARGPFKKMCLYNGKDKYPTMTTKIMNYAALKDIGTFVANLKKTGVIQANQTLEKAVLDLVNLPENSKGIGWNTDGTPVMPTKPDKGGLDNAEHDEGDA
jgi:hypothetical protein